MTDDDPDFEEIKDEDCVCPFQLALAQAVRIRVTEIGLSKMDPNAALIIQQNMFKGLMMGYGVVIAMGKSSDGNAVARLWLSTPNNDGLD